jgi:hypothetical protein
MAAKKPKPVPKKPAGPPTVTCGDCDKKWPVGTAHCECGYEL